MTDRLQRNGILAVGLTTVMALSFATLRGDEPKKPEGPNAAKAGADKPKANAKSKAAANLRMAADLVTFGRESKSPEALILAAKILGTTPVKIDSGTAKIVEGTSKASKETVEKDLVTPESLFAEAKELSDDDNIAGLIADARKIIREGSKGEFDGPAVKNGFAGPNETVGWTGVFRAGELASVTIAGNDGADFDLYVYDDRGNLIRQDTGPTTNASCS